MNIKKYNISKPKKYLKGNEEKTQWNNIGTITEFFKDDGSVSRIIEIPAIGLEANIFPLEPKEAKPSYQSSLTPEEVEGLRILRGEVKKPEVDDDYINPDDIPF